MYTPRIAFAPFTLEPLFGVTIHRSNETLDLIDEKVALTAEEIFGELYVVAKEQQQRLSTFSKVIKTITLGSAVVLIVPITAALFFPGQNYIPLLGALPFVKGVLGTFGIGTTLLIATPEHTWQSKDDTIALICERMTEFANIFDNFKKEPEETKVKELFDKFDGISELMCLPYSKHFDVGHDVSLLSTKGKLFLMDAVVKLLPNKKTLLKEWTSTLELTKDSGFSEPWRRLEIENPSMDAYTNYFKQRENFDSLDLDNQMIQAFKEKVNLFLSKPSW